VAQGPVEITLTEANLSAAFGMPLELERRGDRWTARLRVGGGTPEPPPSS
jgi:iron complex transport system ATP-binding protein